MSKSRKEMNIELWVEKYRPKTLEEFILPDETKTLIQSFIEKKEIPHLLFYGKPGTGKSSLAKFLIKQLDAEAIELNASDDRGIDTIREKVVGFIRLESFSRWKIVFLDEFDYMTPVAMAALRVPMEKYAQKVRFIFAVNYLHKVIDAIQSRCQVIEFKPIDRIGCLKVLKRILEQEGIEYADEDVMKLVEDGGGDLRSLINTAQKFSVSGKFEYHTEFKDKFDVKDLIERIRYRDWKYVRKLMESKLDYTFILRQLFDYVFENISPEVAVDVLGEYIWRDSIVVDKEVNFLCALYSLSNSI